MQNIARNMGRFFKPHGMAANFTIHSAPDGHSRSPDGAQNTAAIPHGQRIAGHITLDIAIELNFTRAIDIAQNLNSLADNRGAPDRLLSRFPLGTGSIFFISALLERLNIESGLNKGQGIDKSTIEPDFPMQMRTC